MLKDGIEKEMLILVDADACPVVSIVEEIAEKYNIPSTLLCDTNHVLDSDYSEVIVVGAGADAVNYKLIGICHKGDIVISQDYGVAAMALAKGAYAIQQSGKWYTNENIDQMLMERHLNKKARRGSHKNHIKGPRKRTDDLERVLKPGGYWFIKMNPYYSKEELESFGYKNAGNNIYEEDHIMRLRQATTNYWKEKFTRFGKEIIYLEFEYPWQEGMNRLFVYQS